MEQYYQMVAANILCEDDRVELLDGLVVDMPPIGPDHNAAVAILNLRFVRTFGDAAIVWVQSSIHLDGYDEPEPDLALLRLRPDFYRSGVPTAPDILLVIEVARSSLAIDLGLKMRIYAAVGIPDYWVVDLAHDTLIRHQDPGPEGYRSVQTLHRGDYVAPRAFPGHEMAVTDILGEA